MDDLYLAKILSGKQSTIESQATHDAGSASIIYMIAVTDSIGGEVTVRPEVDVSAEWYDEEVIEVSSDGDFTEVEAVGEHIEPVPGDTARDDDFPDESAVITSIIDDGDAEDIPDIGTDQDDDPPGEDAEIVPVIDDGQLIDPSDDDLSEDKEPVDPSDGSTIVSCIASVKAGDRVAVMVQDGRMIVIGGVGSGDNGTSASSGEFTKGFDAINKRYGYWQQAGFDPIMQVISQVEYDALNEEQKAECFLFDETYFTFNDSYAVIGGIRYSESGAEVARHEIMVSSAGMAINGNDVSILDSQVTKSYVSAVQTDANGKGTWTIPSLPGYKPKTAVVMVNSNAGAGAIVACNAGISGNTATFKTWRHDTATYYSGTLNYTFLITYERDAL